MKMKKILRKVIALSLVLIFIVSFFGDRGIKIDIVKAASTYNLYSGSSTTPVTELTLNEGEVDLRISSSDNTSVGVDFTWSVTPSNGEIVEITKQEIAIGSGGDTSTSKQIKITPKRPGQATVTLSYANGSTGDSPTSSLACEIYVGYQIDTTDNAAFPIKQGDTNRVLVLDTKAGATYAKSYQTKPTNTNLSFAFTNVNYDMTWTTSNSRVAVVDKLGNITAVGAGYCTIAGKAVTKANAGRVISDSIDVLVMPHTYSATPVTDASEILTTYNSTHEFRPYKTTGEQFYVNATVASELNYKIYQRRGDEVIDTAALASMSTTDKVKLTPDTVSNKVIVNSTSKAGRYYMNTYISDGGTDKKEIINENYLYNAGYPNHMYFDIPIHFNNIEDTRTGTIRMNVNDVYSLLDNSNIQALNHFNIDVPTAYQTYISYTNGELTALKEGTAEVKMTLKSDYADLYEEAAGTSYVLKIEIADGLKLNVTEANIPVGANVLQLKVTNNNIADVTWTSSDKTVVTVDAEGNLTGVKDGEAEVIASAIVDGVVKRAICKVYVYSSANKISITPSELSLFVDDVKTVKAVFEPSGVTSVALKWISLDENIATVQVESGSTRIANVTGKKAGETMIMAVSTNNIVLGTCKVTVTELIDSITLSDTNVEVPLSQGTYTIKATVTPSTASVKDIVWASSDEKVATVDGGKLTLKSAGKTVIAASAPGTNAQTKYCTVTVTESVTGLKLAATEKVVYMGETTTIGYTVLPTTAGNKKVTWSSTKTSVATVNASTGLITPVSVGETTIIARTVEGNYMGTCIVYVKEQAKGITIGLRDVVVQVGEDYQIPYKLNPSSSTEAKITWTSTNTAVATVSEKGVVKGVTQGSTIVMAKLANGEIAYCNVEVQEQVTGLQLNYDKKTIYKGKTFTLKATVTPNGATNANVTFESSNEKVCTVSSKGKVTGKKVGTAIITVTTKEKGYKAFCVVTVKQNVTSIKLNYTSYKLGYKKSVQLKATVTTTASNKKLKWTSSNPSVATVNSSGKVTAKKYGTTTITAAAQDGSGKKATCKIQVVRLVTKVKLNRYSMTVVAGRKATLKATVTPKNATYKTVKWSSSNVSIATVDSRGTVYALQPGIVYITATAKDSSKKKAVCRVEVKEAVSASSITIITDDVVLAVNQSKVMPKSITPPTSTDSVTWESDNDYVATVNKFTGKVTGKHPGTCTITAYTTSGKMDTATVTVLGISRKTLTLEQYSQHQLYLESVSTGVTWESSNIRVATVDNKGNVVARKPGKATIVATYRGTKFTCKVTVKKIK
ncbi:Ig-like domain-containing protein [Anaerosporobacter faecicola]|uniref:Ig-like domain-containing protein n=1 Tax=Anaerosporobacter faecicola TaxID=2718714 RepID=UPI001439884E|nr:Ig-like domain-containing protein [Anaerosporobacter faecicola]